MLYSMIKKHAEDSLLSSNKSDNTKEFTENFEKSKRYLNGWSKSQDKLMAEWSDIAMSYRWLHNRSDKIFHVKTLLINIPVIILSTLGGTSNFAIHSLFKDDEIALQYASFAIGAISLLAGLLTTIGNYLRYAQLEESHRVASISWGKFQRLLAIEIALNPHDRIDAVDFLKICRSDLDRLIEQSPPLPIEAIRLFKRKFAHIKDFKKPDICGSFEHTRIFDNNEIRLRNLAIEATLMLKRKKQTLNELVIPEIEDKISKQIESRLQDVLESKKKVFEEEIKQKQKAIQQETEEVEKALEERKKKIAEQIELEQKIYQESTSKLMPLYRADSSQFETRLQYLKNIGLNSTKSSTITITEPTLEEKNIIITPIDVQKPSEDEGKSYVQNT